MRHPFAVLALLAATACGTTSTPPVAPTATNKGVLSGTVTFREKVALPPNAQVSVRLWDAMLPPAVATVGEAKFQAASQVPLPFELFFDPALIQDSHTYGARASISVDGVVWFQSEQPVPVLTQGAPTVEVVLLVKRVAPPP
ncbi:MAG: YbaY family lipoprotein [Myxococcaceae bacterium]